MKRMLFCIPPVVWAAMIAVSLLLYFFAQADPAVSALFYTPDEGFLQHGAAWERFFYKSVPAVLIALYSAALLLWVFNRQTHRNVLAFNGRKLLYLLLVVGLGSGLLVNALFKDHWGRARPVQTVQFGGEKHFTPPFVLSDQGGKSFSSGHTSGAFALLALVFLARRHRTAVAAGVILYGTAVSLARIAAGGHFFSDVIVSVFIMYIVSAVLYDRMFGCGGRKKEKHGV
jgi:lipid A 4'-phosphatase